MYFPLRFRKEAILLGRSGLLVLGAGLLLSSCSSSGVYTRIPSIKTENVECVVLLHGLGRTHRSMLKIEEKLSGAGYITVNLDYPSRSKTIESVAAENVPLALAQCLSNHSETIHFVSHSMGGIIVRKAMKDNKPNTLGRVVMLGPPNQGSLAVDSLKDRWYYKWINGPAGQQLSTSQDSMPNQLGAVDYPVGIIAGDKPAFFDFWLLPFFRGKSDGKVSVGRTKVEGMNDFLVVHESHSFIMDSEYVQAETINFLKNGMFKHQESGIEKDLETTNIHSN